MRKVEFAGDAEQNIHRYLLEGKGTVVLGTMRGQIIIDVNAEHVNVRYTGAWREVPEMDPAEEYPPPEEA